LYDTIEANYSDKIEDETILKDNKNKKSKEIKDKAILKLRSASRSKLLKSYLG
jgi:hypothetical protein